MLKINDDFYLSYDARSWQLHEYRNGINPKTKEPTRTKAVSYYSSLVHACSAIISRSAGNACTDAKNILGAIKKAKHEIFLAIAGGSSWCRAVETMPDGEVDK